MYVQQEVSLWVEGIGEGRVNISSNEDRVVLFKPSVISMEPNIGSLLGGSSVTLSGSGLDSPNLEVKIGNQQCHVSKTDYSSLLCVVPPMASIDSKLTLHDMKNLDQWGIPISMATNLSFAYSSSKTFNETSVFPTSIGKAGEILTVSIQGYSGENVTELSVKLEGELNDFEDICDIEYNATSDTEVIFDDENLI